MKGEGKGQLLRAPLVVMKWEGGAIMMEELRATHLHGGNHLPWKFRSSNERMTLTSTLSGSKNWIKFSTST